MPKFYVMYLFYVYIEINVSITKCKLQNHKMQTSKITRFISLTEEVINRGGKVYYVIILTSLLRKKILFGEPESVHF